MILDLSQMQSWARALTALLKAPLTILLQGQLGSGKTTLARFLIEALRETATEVPSPTFTLLQIYNSPKGPIHHYDLYRLNSPEAVYELGIEESLLTAITLIEWPEKMLPYLPPPYLKLQLYLIDENSRECIPELHGIADDPLQAFIRAASFA